MQFSLQSAHDAHSTRTSRVASTVVRGLRRAAPVAAVALPALMFALPSLSFAQTAGLPAFNTSPGPNGGTTYSLSVRPGQS